MENVNTYPKNLFIEYEASMLDGLKQMDAHGRKLLIVTIKGKFFSLISIGDLQRAIIKNLPMHTKIRDVLRKSIYVADEKEDIDAVKKKMFEARAEFVPIVDAQKNILKILFWDEVFGTQQKRTVRKIDLPIVVMAGGMGTRLKPLTNVIPKPMIPLGDKTIIEHIFDRFASHGCSKFFLSLNYKADLIEFYLKEQNLSLDLFFFKEDQPMGTAGSLSMLKGIIDQTFFVSNCDIIIEQDYAEIMDYHTGNNNELTIVSALKHYPIPYGIVETGENGSLESLTEKPELTFKINSGMYILEPHLLSEIPAGRFYHITDLIQKIQNRNGNVGVFPVSEKSWKDIGQWKDYLAFSENNKL